MSGFGISKTGAGTPTSDQLVYFNKLTPTTAGVVFSPNTPAISGLLYISSVDASVWIWDGIEYISYSNDSVVLAVTYSEFNTLITASELDIDKKYLITDYQTIYDQPDFSALNTPKAVVSTLTGTVEPLIVTPVAVNKISNVALSTVYPNDAILYDWTFVATEVMGVSAKGRITQRTDTSKNTVSYDSRNVLYKRYDNGSGEYTIYWDNGNASNSAIPTFANLNTNYNINFIVTDPTLANTNDTFLLPNTLFYGDSYDIKAGNLFYNNTFTDLYSSSFGDNCFSNVIGSGNGNDIKNYFHDNSIYGNFHDNNIDSGFYLNTIANGFYQNTIGAGFNNNTINGVFRDNVIGETFRINTINGDFINNKIQAFFNNNTIGAGFNNNYIGYNFYINTIGINFYSNNISDSFNNNTVGDNFYINIIGINFNINTISDFFNNNTIGDYFYGNTVGIDFKYNNIGYDFYINTIGDTFEYNSVGDEFMNNIINNDFSSNTFGNFCWSNNVGFNFIKNNIGNTFQNNTVGNTINDLFIQNNYNSQTIVSGTNTQTDISGLNTGFVKNTNGVLQDIPFGAASQYVRGDGTLASFPDVAGGGGGQVYYLNGGTSEGTIGGVAYYQMSTGAVIGTGVDFTSGTVNNVAFANFITDVGKPTQETIPAGVWIFQCYLSASTSSICEVYATVEVYNGTTFTVLSTSLHEVLTGNNTIDLYTFTCAVPEYTPLTPTDRIAIRFYPNNLGGSRTITLHTQDSHLSSIQTTFTTGIASLDGLTAAAQYFQIGTSGTDFNITTSGDDIHVFNLPTASATKRGLLSTADWTTFNGKIGGSGTTNYLPKFSTSSTISNSQIFDNGTNVGIGTITPAKLLDVNGDILVNGLTIGRGNSNIATNTVVGSGAGNSITTGANNTFSGISAGRDTTTGGQNSFFGQNSGRLNTSGEQNSYFGFQSGYSNTTGNYNTFIGKDSAYNNTTGSSNTFLGINSGYSNTTGSNSVFLGDSSGRYIADGTTALTIASNSIFLGKSTKALADNQSNQIVIGYNAIGKGSNTVNIGNTSITNTYLNGAVTFNNAFTFPTTDGTSTQALTTNGAGTVSWASISSAIPQAQLIYVDSANGVNATTGRGNINTPYLTPEYALSNTTNTGTFTANTATNTTLSAISDVNNALLEIGMYVSGSGIPFGTIIVAKGNQGGNANTVTLSKSTTATATGVTFTWVKTYNVILNGSFVVTSSLFKEGMYINSQSAEISWGAFTLFNINTYVNKIPYYILGQGNYFGTSISSVFILTNATQSQGYSLSITFGNIETIGTGYVFSLTSGTNENYINIVGNFANARFGNVCYIDGGTTSLMFNSYGLLGGFSFGFNGTKRLLGTHTTPSSVSVLGSGYGTTSLANLTGSTTWSGQSSHRGVLNGTTHTLGGTVDIYSTAGSGTVTVNGGSNTFTAVTGYTLNVDSNCICYAYGSGTYTISAISGSLYFYGQTDANSAISGSGTINNYGYVYVVSMGSFTGTFNNYGTVSAGQFGGGGNVNNYGSITMIYYGITVASNKTFVNRGTIISNGSLLNSNAIITLNNATGTFENYGSIINNTTDITKAVIEKTAGKLYLRQGSYLKVANSLSPIKCTANTSASKDVYYFGVTDNCNGTTYGLGFAFDGSSFAPNDLVGGTLYENVNY